MGHFDTVSLGIVYLMRRERPREEIARDIELIAKNGFSSMTVWPVVSWWDNPGRTEPSFDTTLFILDECEKRGFKVIAELVGQNPGYEMIPDCRMKKEYLINLTDGRMSYWVGHRNWQNPINYNHPEVKEIIAETMTTCEALSENTAKLNSVVSFAKEIGSQIVNLYCSAEEGVGGRDSREAFCRMIEEVLPNAGVVLTLENELNSRPGTFAQFEWWKWLAQELPEPFGLTFDLANFIASGCSLIPEDIKPVVHRIRHLHVKDIVPLTEELRKQYPERASFTGASGEYFCVPLGQGIVEYQPFLKALASYSGYCTLEALREEEQYRESLDFLQTLL